MNEDAQPDDMDNDAQDSPPVELQELVIQRYELISRSGTGANRVRNSPRIRLTGVPGSSTGVLRAGNIYFRRPKAGIEAPRFAPNVRAPYVSMFVWLDQLPMILAQLALPDRRLVFQRFADGNLRAELLARPT